MIKKLLFLAILITGLSSASKAQLAQKNSSYIQLGYGYPSGMRLISQFFKLALDIDASDTTEKASFKYSGVGPVHFRYEYMLGGRVGLGLSSNAELGTFKLSNTYTDAYNRLVTAKMNFSLWSINALLRANFHFLKRSERVDLYYGAAVGYSHTRAKYSESLDGYKPTAEDQQYIDEFNDYLNTAFKAVPIAVESVFGGRFMLGNSAGLYFEVGYAKAIAQVGFFAKMGNRKGYYRTDLR